jgi:small subunit ribosomal protein S20
MANTRSAKKAARQTTKRTLVNKARVSRMRGEWRGVEEAIAKGDAKGAADALKRAESQTMRAAGHKVVHKKAASRKVSRLTQRVKKLSGK